MKNESLVIPPLRENLYILVYFLPEALFSVSFCLVLITPCFLFPMSFFKDFVYVCMYVCILERGEGREKERERNIHMREKHQSVASHMPPTRDPATTQACALTGN